MSGLPDGVPGLSPPRLVMLMRGAIERCRLDLSGRVVLTEAASGAWVVTPVMAAMAGAVRVRALTRTTGYGAAEDVRNSTLELAGRVGVRDRVEVITAKTPEVVAAADVVTNSGHVRPIDATMIAWMKPSAVVSLMYEAWELRPGDVDLDACRRKGIAVGATNERHPAVDVFSYLGVMAIKLATDAAVGVHGSRVLVLCDNAFGPFIARGLAGAGAVVDVRPHLRAVDDGAGYDVVLVALRPRVELVLSRADAVTIAERWPGTVVVQFWGDVDRSALRAADLPVWPPDPPPPGHMGILPSAVGPDPVVRLQAGGLKVGEVLSASRPGDEAREFVQAVCGERRWRMSC